MDQRVKQLWIEALRSGKYKQGQERLKRDDEYCCLGVLCDLHAKETGKSWTTFVPDHDVTGEYYDGEAAVLPKSVVAWADLTDSAPYVGEIGEQESLLDLNDGVIFNDVVELEPLDFNAIADLIEEYL